MTPEQKAEIRKRHKLPDNADVHVISTKLNIFEDGHDPHKFTARITTDALDRQDEVVIPGGGMFGDFLNSGAIFWNHQYDSPVGYPDKTKQIIKGQNFVEAGGIFMKRPADWTGEFFPDFVREFVTQGVAAGINPGVSIGFMPVESRRPSKADIEHYGKDIQMVHSKWKLLEFSIAPVQANTEAVVIAVGKGLIRREVAKAMGWAVPDAPPAPPRVLRCVLALPSQKTLNVEAIVKAETRRQIYRAFGRVYLPA